jgi:hypothetical protein
MKDGTAKIFVGKMLPPSGINCFSQFMSFRVKTQSEDVRDVSPSDLLDISKETDREKAFGSAPGGDGSHRLASPKDCEIPADK